MGNHHRVLRSLKILAIGNAKAHILIVTQDICSMSGTIHPAGRYRIAGRKAIGEILAGIRVVIACLPKPIPRLRAVR